MAPLAGALVLIDLPEFSTSDVVAPMRALNRGWNLGSILSSHHACKISQREFRLMYDGEIRPLLFAYPNLRLDGCALIGYADGSG